MLNTKLLKGVVVGGLLLSFPQVAGAESRPRNADSATYYLSLGKEQEIARKYSEAWRYFDKAASFDPTNVEAQVSIAEVCTKMNKMAPAIQALNEVVKLRPDDGKALLKLGKLYFNFSQWDKVIAIMPKVQQQLPDAKNVAYMLGKSYYSIENYGKALEYLQQAVKEDEENGDAYYLIAHTYTTMSNYKQAIPFYERSLKLDQQTSYETRVYEFAMVLATAGKFDESIVWFQKALDKGYKARDDFYTNFAYTLADAHKTDKAIEMMEEMLKRRPTDIQLINGMADVCYHSGKYKEAINYWDKLISLDEHNARPIYQIGMAYIKLGNVKDGQQLCDKAIAMDPSLAVLRHEKRM